MVCIRIHSVFTDDLIKMKKRLDNLNGCPLIDTSTDYNAFYTLLSFVVIYVVSLQCFFATVATASCVQHDGTAVCCVVSCMCMRQEAGTQSTTVGSIFCYKELCMTTTTTSFYLLVFHYSLVQAGRTANSILHARSHASIFEVLLSRQRLKNQQNV
jgi:hypothetical protein